MAPSRGVFGDPMSLCLLRFAAPFNLLLPSDKFYYFHDSGQLVAVRTSTKQGIKFFSYEKDHTDWIAQDKVEIRHSKSVDPLETLVCAYKLEEPIHEFKGGLVDEVDYTVLDLFFEDAAGDFIDELDKHAD
jgi:hypothetical protein